MIVKPETLIGWHRQGFRLWWRWKSRLGRPRIPADLRQLIVRMVRENPTRGEACSGGTLREARDPGIASDGAGVLAARHDSKGRAEKLLTALEKLRPESRRGHRGR